jgi:hypothetical protein
VNATSGFALFAIGAALLAFWIVTRFPAYGPQTFGSALLATAAAFLLQAPLPSAVSTLASSEGVGAALVLIVLPSLVVLFWTSGCLVRSVVALLAPHGR